MDNIVDCEFYYLSDFYGSLNFEKKPNAEDKLIKIQIDTNMNLAKDLTDGADFYEFQDCAKVFVRPHFDLDWKVSEGWSGNVEDWSTYALCGIDFICRHFNCEQKDVCVMTDKKYDNSKLSLHFVVPHLKCPMKYLVQLKNNFRDEMEQIHLDIGIYREGQNKWRALGATKYKNNQPTSEGFKLWEENDIEWNYEDTVIYNTKTCEMWNPSTFTIQEHTTKKNDTQTKPLENVIVDERATPKDIDMSKITEEDKLLADIIDVKYIDNYSDWTKLIWACRVDNNFELAHYISSLGAKYDGSACATKLIWEDFTESRNGFSKATFYHYAKISNPKRFAEIRAKYHIDDEVVMDTIKLINIKSVLKDEKLEHDLSQFDEWSSSKKKQIIERKKIFEKEKINDEMRQKQKYFEKFHFKVMSPPCFGRLAYHKTSLYSQNELNLMYENVDIDDKKFVDLWRKTKYIRTFENVDFLPFPCECPSYTFNTFSGLKASKLPSNTENVDFDILLNHMRILTGNDSKGYDYLLKYIAHLVQRPGELPRTSLVFRSKQGVGKNVFFENLGRYLIGNDLLLQTAEMDKVIGRFSMINNKLLVIMDEANGKESFSNSDKIKNIITAEQIAWERKGIDGIKINNCGRYLIFSNNNTPVKIEMSDRRFVVYDCANDVRNNLKYFKKLGSAFKNPQVIRAFYDYLMNIDISDWDSINDRPITKAYSNIQSANIPVVARFLEDFIDNCNNSKNEKDSLFNGSKIQASSFYRLFTGWCSENKFKHDYTANKFGRELNDYDGLIKKKFSGGVRGYSIDIEKLYTYLEDNDYVEKLEHSDESFDDFDDEEDEEEI